VARAAPSQAPVDPSLAVFTPADLTRTKHPIINEAGEFVSSMRRDDCLWTQITARRICQKPIND